MFKLKGVPVLLFILAILACDNSETTVQETDDPITETGGDTGDPSEPVFTVEQDGFHLLATWSDGEPVTAIEVNAIPATLDRGRFRLPDPCAMLGESVAVTASGGAGVVLQLDGRVGWDPESFEVQGTTALCDIADGWVELFLPSGVWWVDSTDGGFYATPGGDRAQAGSPAAWPMNGWYDVRIGVGASLFLERFEE